MRELLSVTTTWGAVLSFSVFAIHPDVYAQQILTERQREQLDVLKVLSDDVSMRDGALSSLTGISIEAGEADKQARIRWSINQGERSMSFAVAAPVSDDGKPTQLASLDGLADALTFSVGFTQYFAKPTDSIQAIVSAQEKICKRLNTATCDDSAVLKAGTATDHREFLVVYRDNLDEKGATIWMRSWVSRQTHHDGRFARPQAGCPPICRAATPLPWF